MIVDYLLHTLKYYKLKIKNAEQFLKRIGFVFNKKWISYIKSHKSLFEKTNTKKI